MRAELVTPFFLGLALTLLALAVLQPIAERAGLVDRPGGRKDHAGNIPLVGGLAILLALWAIILMGRDSPQALIFAGCLTLLALVGVLDDSRDLRPRFKFAAQIVAALVMVFGANVVLNSVGDLVGWRPLGLSLLAVPLTVFAVVGVVNAINMVDGQDGLAGLICLQAFFWYGLVALESGLVELEVWAFVLCGALAGFLTLNARSPWRARARVFLGDSGSLMLGFALAWFAIDLTQGAGRSFPPIAALWVLMLPLADCVSLMTRRLRSGRSPFVADREHIHHYLLARGFSVASSTALLAALSTLFGAVGFIAWRLDWPEAALFWPFFIGYFAYHRWIQRAWRKHRGG